MRATRRMACWVCALVLAACTGCGDDDGGQGATSSGAGGATTGTGGGGTGGAGGAGGSGGQSMTSTGSSMGMPCNGNTCDLTLIGTGFTPHDGQTVYAGILVQGQMGFEWDSSAQVANGGFTMQASGALQKGQSYFLNYFADMNGNGDCEITPTDHVWRVDIPAVQEHLTITLVHNTDFSNLGCGGFP